MRPDWGVDMEVCAEIGHVGFTIELTSKMAIPPSGEAQASYGWRVLQDCMVVGSGDGLPTYVEATEAAVACVQRATERSEG